jgi:hypothetical protein
VQLSALKVGPLGGLTPGPHSGRSPPREGGKNTGPGTLKGPSRAPPEEPPQMGLPGVTRPRSPPRYFSDRPPRRLFSRGSYPALLWKSLPFRSLPNLSPEPFQAHGRPAGGFPRVPLYALPSGLSGARGGVHGGHAASQVPPVLLARSLGARSFIRWGATARDRSSQPPSAFGPVAGCPVLHSRRMSRSPRNTGNCAKCRLLGPVWTGNQPKKQQQAASNRKKECP